MFKKNKYTIVKKVLSKELCELIYNYFTMKKQVCLTIENHKYFPPSETIMGTHTLDEQIPNTYSSYADILSETLLLKIHPIMEKSTGLKLNPSYTYTRVYKKGDELKRHKDRFSCEISTTLNIGGDHWDIYLEPSGKEGMKGVKVSLNPGDMLIYKGCELEHWRNKFKGKECCQIFLHYNNKKTPGSKFNLFDKRPHLGLPSWFKK